jgi:hypothetical protein
MWAAVCGVAIPRYVADSSTKKKTYRFVALAPHFDVAVLERLFRSYEQMCATLARGTPRDTPRGGSSSNVAEECNQSVRAAASTVVGRLPNGGVPIIDPITRRIQEYVPSLCTTLRHTTSHHVTPRHTTSHHVTPRHTTLRHTTSHHVTPRHAFGVCLFIFGAVVSKVLVWFRVCIGASCECVLTCVLAFCADVRADVRVDMLC